MFRWSVSYIAEVPSKKDAPRPLFDLNDPSHERCGVVVEAPDYAKAIAAAVEQCSRPWHGDIVDVCVVRLD